MFSFKIDLDAKDFYTTRAKILETPFGPEVWMRAERKLQDFTRKRANKISSHSVSTGTTKWRAKMAKVGASVPTYVGTKAPVLAGSRVGKRTNTFLSDLKDADGPGVVMSIDPGGGAYHKGSLTLEIDLKKFTNEYPAHFSEYLEGRGIVPPGGVLDMEEDMYEEILDGIEESIFREFA